MWFFFFQAEDGIRDLVRSRGLGDVYKRQGLKIIETLPSEEEQELIVPQKLEEDEVEIDVENYAETPSQSNKEADEQQEVEQPIIDEDRLYDED